MESLMLIPPGYRFHPTDEELVDYYLKKKVASPSMALNVIKDVDLYKIEPWDIQEICGRGNGEEKEWYFFSHKDKKYPTSTRTNRATGSGFWKATGRDKAIYAKQQDLIGMRKTLVFYRGRAPNGLKSDWIMHEYRLETDENGPPREEGWVVCRVFRKKLTTSSNNVNVRVRTANVADRESWFTRDGHYYHLPPLLESPRAFVASSLSRDDRQDDVFCDNEALFSNSELTGDRDHDDGNVANEMMAMSMMNTSSDDHDHQLMDWRVLDKFVASQLMSQEDDEMISGSSHQPFRHLSDKQVLGNGSSGSCQLYPWK